LVLPFAPPVDAATFESSVTGAAHDAKLGFENDIATLGASFQPTPGSAFRAAYRAIHRDGRRPETLFYGFSNFVHFPQPVDDTIHEGTADLSYAGDSFNVGLNYVASAYQNDFHSFRVQNPAPFAGGAPIGAVAADPDNTAHLVSLTSSTALPTSFPFQVAGTV